MSDIIIPVGENETDKNNVTEKPQTDKNIDKPHNGKPIATIKISPNGNYFVTRSHEDKSFVGWNVDINVGQLKLDTTVNISDHIKDAKDLKKFRLKQMCVFNDKKLAYISNHRYLGK